MSSIKICDSCKEPIQFGMPTYFIQRGTLGGMFGKKITNSGEFCHVCYKKIDDLIIKSKTEVKQ